MAIAADIPPELFDHILRHITIMDGRLPGDGDKHAASVCGQVCRHWAHHCRQFLFHRLVIDSEDNLSRLRALVQAVPPAGLQPIGEYLDWIVFRVAFSTAEKPWIHHLLLRPFLGSNTECDINLSLFCDNAQGPDIDSKDVGRGIFHGLPRTLPGNKLAIRDLDLENVRLRNTVDLRRLLSHFRSYEGVVLRNVRWDTQPEQATVAPIHRAFSKQCEMVEAAGADAAILLLWLFPLFLQRSSCRVVPEDYAVLLDLFTTLPKLLGPSRVSVWPRKPSYASYASSSTHTIIQRSTVPP